VFLLHFLVYLSCNGDLNFVHVGELQSLHAHNSLTFATNIQKSGTTPIAPLNFYLTLNSSYDIVKIIKKRDYFIRPA
jgi:hypothetical protein